eukprot:s3509_g9.t1
MGFWKKRHSAVCPCVAFQNSLGGFPPARWINQAIADAKRERTQEDALELRFRPGDAKQLAKFLRSWSGGILSQTADETRPDVQLMLEDKVMRLDSFAGCNKQLSKAEYAPEQLLHALCAVMGLRDRNEAGLALQQTILKHCQLPIGMGSGPQASSLEQKLICMCKKFFAETRSKNLAQRVMHRVLGICTDMGTEMGFAQLEEGFAWKQVLPEYMQDSGLQTEEGVLAQTEGVKEEAAETPSAAGGKDAKEMDRRLRSDRHGRKRHKGNQLSEPEGSAAGEGESAASARRSKSDRRRGAADFKKEKIAAGSRPGRAWVGMGRAWVGPGSGLGRDGSIGIRSRKSWPLSQSLQQGWTLTTDCSGIGTAEEAARCLAIAATRKAHSQGKVEYAARLHCQRAGDKEADCGQMLLERDHALTHGPACVHGNIGERCDRQIWEDLHEH